MTIPGTVEQAGRLPVDHFPHLTPEAKEALFLHAPRGLAGELATPRGIGLGATLYLPGDEDSIFAKLRETLDVGALAAVICLEDAVRGDRAAAAAEHVVRSLQTADGDPNVHLPPLLYLRPRGPALLAEIGRNLGPAIRLLTGICIPKFSSECAEVWLDVIDRIGDESGHRLEIMPILEGPAALYPESRVAEFLDLRSLLLERRDQVTAVRVGGTDLCGLLGLRRRADETIYDLGPVRDAIVDMVGVFTRNNEFVVSGPVWEYFHSDARLWKPQLRESLFAADERPDLRSRLISRHLDGLIKEVLADRAHGVVGKTIIHPSHIRPVNALHAVTYEEWVDAGTIVAAADQGGGASASAFANKMNEAGPHRRWAERVLVRSEIFGVLREGQTFIALLDS